MWLEGRRGVVVVVAGLSFSVKQSVGKIGDGVSADRCNSSLGLISLCSHAK